VVEGRVLMTGRVATQETRIEASRLAWTTPGVADVINELEISDRTVGLIRPRDTWISTQLRARLVGDAHVRVVNYHIETLDGTVYLFGVAQDEAELERVAGHAQAIRGVNRIVSHMRIKNDPFAIPAQGA
jgi:osmotically-inducible protein OsmY